MGLCHENQGALSPLLPGSRMESCPAQSGPCQLAPCLLPHLCPEDCRRCLPGPQQVPPTRVMLTQSQKSLLHAFPNLRPQTGKLFALVKGKSYPGPPQDCWTL